MTFSVLMSIYAGEKPEYLQIALESLACQTLRADEVVLVEDGPLPDPLLRVIEGWRTTLNIRSVRLPRNVGLARALNAGLEHCSHELVARMDGDDISLPERFEKQVRFMTDNPDIAASSAALDEFDEDGVVFSSRVLPLAHEELVEFARRRSPLSHAVAIFRKSAVQSVGGYPPFKRSQDVALWSLLIVRGYRLANLPDTLFKVRAGAAFMTRNGLRNLDQEYAVIRYQRSIGFLSRRDMFRNVCVRFALAIVPGGVKKLLYAHKADPAGLLNAVLKRGFDITLAATGLLLAAPLIAAGWIAATLETRRNGFFLQERIGRHGKPFRIVKLRTMRDTAADRGTVTTSHDPRITRSGAILRRTKIDELPQLWNVLKGQMSLVGPRPERPELIAEIERKVPGYQRRHQVPPGLTGFAQIHGRYDTTADHKIGYDLQYLVDWSLVLDIQILLRTVWVVVSRRV